MCTIRSSVAVLLLLALIGCEEMVTKPDEVVEPKQVEVQVVSTGEVSTGSDVIILNVRGIKVDGTFAHVNYRIPAITQSVVDDGYVLAFVDLSTEGKTWWPLPRMETIASGEVGMIDYAYSVGWLSIQFDGSTPGMTAGMAMLYDGRYRMKVIVYAGIDE